MGNNPDLARVLGSEPAIPTEAPAQLGAAEPAGAAPIRVAMVISSYHPIVGGAEKQVAQLARLMQSQSHEVTIITRRYPGLEPHEVIDGISVHRVSSWGASRFGSLSFIIGAARALRQMRPDVIHCHSMFSPAIAGALGHRLTGAPLLIKPMCSDEASSIARKRFGKRRIAHFARAASRFIAVSSAIKRELVGLGVPEAKISYIPNGVDLSRFRPSATEDEKKAERARLGLPEDAVLFFFAGRIAAQKRLPLLLQTWPSIHAAHPGARLMVAGANRLTPSKYATDQADPDHVPEELLQQPGVDYLGHVDDMPAYLRAADVFVLPSSREGLSNALLEACSSGLPTISCSIGGAEDFIVDGQNGLLFAPDDQEALGAAMMSVAGDRDARARIGREAVRTVRDQFDISVTADRLLEAYDALRAARGPAR